MIVLDASVAVEMVTHSAASKFLAKRLILVGLFHAPHLLDVEVANVLRRASRKSEMTPQRARQAMDDFLDLRIIRHPHRPYLPRIWELRENFTAYDACYLALTEALGATMLTRDSALSSARLRHGKVEVI